MQWQKELDAAQTAALSAGHYLFTQNNQQKIEHQAEKRDIKLEADRQAEKIIIEHLKLTAPHPILAEESGSSSDMDLEKPAWVIDPLDGTLNYSRSVPLSVVSIALCLGFNPLLGVVYDFNRQELFSGISGLGAYCNGLPIKSSVITSPEKAVLTTGFPVDRDFNSASLQSFLNRVQNFKKIRLLGSAALSLAYTACAKVDAYYEEDIMFWDVAAGMAIAKAAGAWVNITESGRKSWAVEAKAAGNEALAMSFN